MTYKERLVKFNSTDKYQSEMKMLRLLMNPTASDVLIDYGCGLGTCADFMHTRTGSKVLPYDITEEYYEGTQAKLMRSLNGYRATWIYFMHSLSHIHNPHELLTEIRHSLKPGGAIAIITPNAEWQDQQDPAGYNADPTYINPFTIPSLIRLVESAGYTIRNYGQLGRYCAGMNERIFLTAGK